MYSRLSCSIENEAGDSVTGEVVRIDEAHVDIVPHDNSFAIAIGDKVPSFRGFTASCCGFRTLRSCNRWLGLSA